MSSNRMRQVDRVRWRLLPSNDRIRLETLAEVRSQSLSTVLRILRRRHKGDVDAYMVAEGLLIRLPPLRGRKAFRTWR